MDTMFALFDLGGGQIILILLLVLIFFGARRLPELAKGLGQGIKEFKKATREVTDEIQQSMDDSGHSAPPKRAETEHEKLSASNDPGKSAAVPQSTEQKS
jgi:sec-independent protein translocase protein TatA